MKYYLTKEEMNKIEELADYALSAHNKQDAKRYVQQIRLAVNDVWGASNNILNEMVAAIDNATGMVSDKTNKVSIAKQQIIKTKMFCVEKATTD